MKDLSSNDFAKQSLAQALEEMKSLQGEDFSINTINLAELERRTGISRQRRRTHRKNGFKYLPHGRTGRSNKTFVLVFFASANSRNGDFNPTLTSTTRRLNLPKKNFC